MDNSYKITPIVVPLEAVKKELEQSSSESVSTIKGGEMKTTGWILLVLAFALLLNSACEMPETNPG